MRSLWYSLIKPALARGGFLEGHTKNGTPIPWDSKLSVYLAELVRMGETTYAEMRIFDGSRQRQPAMVITQGVIDGAQLVGAHSPWVILFTEKDTIWPVVARLASRRGAALHRHPLSAPPAGPLPPPLRLDALRRPVAGLARAARRAGGRSVGVALRIGRTTRPVSHLRHRQAAACLCAATAARRLGHSYGRPGCRRLRQRRGAGCLAADTAGCTAGR